MDNLRLFTDRLELVAATMELAGAEINDVSRLATLLNVARPAMWPPPLNDEHSQRAFLASLERSNEAGWNLWYCLRRQPRELVGNAGFKGNPRDGVAEVGYSMLEAHQRQGYCTEAVRALLGWAFQHPRMRMVVAHTLPGLTPSIRVMEKCGFVFAGSGPIEDGLATIRYELASAAFPSNDVSR
jgi:RimJ/RimL family protein N-acetyltransferase